MTTWGEAVITRKLGQPHIERADKYVRISIEFLCEARLGHSEWVEIDDDDVLTLRAANRTVQYRILGSSTLGNWDLGAERISPE